jgi:hypothetical protein
MINSHLLVSGESEADQPLAVIGDARKGCLFATLINTAGDLPSALHFGGENESQFAVWRGATLDLAALPTFLRTNGCSTVRVYGCDPSFSNSSFSSAVRSVLSPQEFKLQLNCWRTGFYVARYLTRFPAPTFSLESLADLEPSYGQNVAAKTIAEQKISRRLCAP